MALAISAVLLSVLLVSSAGSAQSTTLRNIAPAPHSAPPDTPLGDIGAAIELAANRLGWKIDSASAGESIASILVRGKHLAVVRIGFDERNFWIDYVSSQNLDYTEKDRPRTHRTRRTIKGPRIHRNYNKWVENLANGIRVAARRPPDSAKSTVADDTRPLLIADELKKLHGLVESGVITKEEFEQQKSRLLGR